MSEQTSTVPAVGTPAPDFTLPDQSGKPVHLAALRGRPVILYFYPKDDTPGCTTEACGFRDSWQMLEARGAVVLGISRDSVASHQKFAEKYGLPFTLLADEDGAVTRMYGAWGERSMYGKTYTGTLRTTFAIRPDGTIGHVWENVKPSGHAGEVLDYLKANEQGTTA